MDLPETIVCVDCGGTCHLLTAIDIGADRDDALTTGPVPVAAESFGVDERSAGSVIGVYRCELCLDRWDVIFDDEGG